jgi:prepilin-type N-terminal cleavage/methylation domain-containing protein
MSSAPQEGFTLIEVAVVLALLSILAAVAIPQWGKFLPSHHLNSSVRQVQSELHNIKMRAAAENIGFQLAYLEGASSYTIQKDKNPWVTKPLPEGIVITKAGIISFSPRGTAGSDRVRLRNSQGACTQVVVSQTGRVRVCKPGDCRGDC